MKRQKKPATMVAMETTMEPADYLKRPYGRVVVPEADGSFRGEIIEFPGCIALGDTAPEALARLEDVATSWLAAKIAKQLPVPEPMEGVDYSGKLNVRLGRDLHRRAAHMAAHQGVSLNQFIVSSVAERLGVFTRPATVHAQSESPKARAADAAIVDPAPA